LEGGYLLLDESADEKAGDKSAGAGRQHNGRLGKIEMSQVGVFLAYYKDVVWSWVDGELFIPEHWFGAEMSEERKRAGVPKERKFATKVKLGWQMIKRAYANGLPFKAVACDDLYGRSGWLRRKMSDADIVYMADVPEDTQVYLSKPDFGVPVSKPGRKGRGFKRPRILSSDNPMKIREIVHHFGTDFQRIIVRHMERGELDDPFMMRRVWTVRDGKLAEEWLVIRHEYGKRYTYSLSNASEDTPKEELARLKCVRHFVERANQDAKSEVGWDELEARKYRAWNHHLALTIMAMWFIAQIKHDWSSKYPRDSKLSEQLEVELLPALSVANVRELLKAVMPLQQLTPEEATRIVMKHLVNRAYSTASRLKAQREERAPT
jgi:SRSO17 transposase